MSDFDERFNGTNNTDGIDNTNNAGITNSADTADSTNTFSNAEMNNNMGNGFDNNSYQQQNAQPYNGTYSDLDNTQPQGTAGYQSVKNDISQINLDGAQPSGDSATFRHGGYTENIHYKKPHKSRNRFIAAMVSLTVLNLAIMGGTFFAGTRYSQQQKQVASKQELVSSLSGDSGDNTNGAAQTANTTPEMATTEIAKKVGPAVVGIRSTMQQQTGFFGSTSQAQAEGSGIILSEDGYIATNNHVVDGATAVSVILNTGTELEAKIVGKDEQTDLAVIKIEPTEQLTVATIGDSTNLEVGERVVAIGNPMGLEFFGSVTEGIVSAVNRKITVDNRTMSLIQTDAAINSGNSGGALINRFGEVIGINSVKVSSEGVEGMGFAIPSSEAKPIISDLLQYGYVKGRPVIGISTREVTEYMARAYSWPQGVQVMEVTGDSAKNAGLQQGDIITEVEGEKITDSDKLNEIKNKHNPGDKLKMTVYKYSTGRTETVEVTLSEQLPG